MLLLSELAYALPMTLFIWGLSYLLTISRKKVQARKSRIIIHFSALLILNTLMNIMTMHTKNGTGTEGGVFLISIILSLLSCSILRYFEQKHNKNISKIDANGLPIKYNDINNSDPTEFNESDAYLLIANEIQSQNMDKGIWLKAMVEAGGSDHNQQTIIYTGLRLKQMQSVFMESRPQHHMQTESLSAKSQIEKDIVRLSAITSGVAASEIKRTSTKEPVTDPLNYVWVWITVIIVGVGSLFWIKFCSSDNVVKTSEPVAQQNGKDVKTPIEVFSKQTIPSVETESSTPIKYIDGVDLSLIQKPLNLDDFKYKSRHLIDGYQSGKKIHMLDGGNLKKPYVGFILNMDTKIEDELILKGEYTSAIEIYKNLDSKGDKTASHNLGLMYIRGLGVKKDIEDGMTYLEKSMESLPNYSTSYVYYKKARKELNLDR